MNIDFSILQSLTIPEGEVTQIIDANGIILWTAIDWSEVLIDFTYTENSDGTATILDWKDTLDGVSSTKVVVPDNADIIF